MEELNIYIFGCPFW